MTASFDRDTVARLAAGDPDWLRARRLDAFDRFAALPWPEPSLEEWRHTDIRDLDLAAFDPDLRGETDLDGPEGSPELLQDWIGSAGVSAYEEKLATLNAAFGRTRFVHVARGQTLETPVVATHAVEPGGAAFPHTVILAEDGASLTFIDRYVGEPATSPALCVANVEIYAGAGANVAYLAVQDWPQHVWHFAQWRAVIGRDATVRSLAATLGGKRSRSIAQAVLDGQGGHAEMLGVAFGDSDQHIDNRTLQLHRGPHSSSEVYYKVALKGSSSAVYSGLVDLEKEGIQADAQQANRNLLLSDRATADASPFLEIKTSEVARATHGVSVGRPDKDTLFYMAARGIDPVEAEKLYVKGFLQEIIDRVHVPEIRQRLEEAVEAELALEAE